MNANDPIPFTQHGPRRTEHEPPCCALSLYAEDRYKRVCRMIGYALTAEDPAIWWQTAAILESRLAVTEIASIAFAALRALGPEERAAVCTAASFDDGPSNPEPSDWILQGIAEYRAARDRRAKRK